MSDSTSPIAQLDTHAPAASRPVIIDARHPQATQPLLGLPPFRRVLAAAHAAGLGPLLLRAEPSEAEALLSQVRADPRLAGAQVRISSEHDAEADALCLDGAAVLNGAGVEALSQGRDPAPGSFVPADASLSEKKRALLRSLANPADGLVDTWINRPLSRQLTRALASTGISPNAITVLSCLIGLAGVAGIASRDFAWGIAGALLFQLSAAVDCVDGEIARLTHQSSPFGARLDLTLDNLVHLALFAAMAWASAPLLGPTLAAAVGGVACAGGLIAFLLVYHLTFGAPPRPSSPLKRILDRFTNRDFSLAVLAFAAFGRWDILLVFIAIGSNLFWLFLLASRLRATREP